jgi:flavodoxin
MRKRHMNTLVIYDSLYGNTKEIADTITNVFSRYGQSRLVVASQVTDHDFTGIGLVALGGPTQRHGLSPVIDALLDRTQPEKLSGISAVAFDTRMHFNSWLSGSAADRIAKRLRQYGVDLLLPPESFFVKGAEGPLEQGEQVRAAAWARTVIETKIKVGSLAHQPAGV